MGAQLVHGHTRRILREGKRTRTPEYNVYQLMIQRCHNSNDKNYAIYGGRGIQVCARWRESFTNFLADVGLRPSDTHSLDRYPDQNGNYEPSNVRWATRTEQHRNKRTNRLLTVNGVTRTLVEWSEVTGMGPMTISGRIDRMGWTPEQAILTPRLRAARNIGKRSASQPVIDFNAD